MKSTLDIITMKISKLEETIREFIYIYCVCKYIYFKLLILCWNITNKQCCDRCG